METEPFLVRVARAWGWRAYAIPVLVVLTVVVLADALSPAREKAESNIEGAVSSSASPGPIPSGNFPSSLAVTQLPPGPELAVKSSNKFIEFSKPSAKVGHGQAKTFRYAVEIEDTINQGTFGGGDAFAATVNAVLSDARGWTASPDFAFEAVTKEDKPNLVVQLVSPQLAKELCGNSLDAETSCFYGSKDTKMPGRVLVNEARWVRGAISFQGDLGLYRQYLINHEVGHGLGYASHEACPNNGAVAPIMMQQTLSLANDELHQLDPNEVYEKDGKTCTANGWPFPFGPEKQDGAPTKPRSK